MKISPEKFNPVEIEELTQFDERIDQFCEIVNLNREFIVKRSRDYLNWRYCNKNGGNYRVTVAVGKNVILGYCVSRVNSYDAAYPIGYIVDVLSLPDQIEVAYTLVKNAIDHLTRKSNLNLFFSNSDSPYVKALHTNSFINVPESLYPTPKVSCTIYHHNSRIQELGRNNNKEAHFTFGDLDAI